MNGLTAGAKPRMHLQESQADRVNTTHGTAGNCWLTGTSALRSASCAEDAENAKKDQWGGYMCTSIMTNTALIAVRCSGSPSGWPEIPTPICYSLCRVYSRFHMCFRIPKPCQLESTSPFPHCICAYGPEWTSLSPSSLVLRNYIALI